MVGILTWSAAAMAFGEMYPVVHLSSQYLNQADLAAMATYLLGDQPPAPQPVKAISADAAQVAPGRRHYVAVCAGCHGREGEGKPHVAVSMAGNSTVPNAEARTLILSMLDGIAAQGFPRVEAMQEMPGFAGRMSDDELAQLANYLRATWGGQPADVRPGDVKALRAAGPGHGRLTAARIIPPFCSPLPLAGEGSDCVS